MQKSCPGCITLKMDFTMSYYVEIGVDEIITNGRLFFHVVLVWCTGKHLQLCRWCWKCRFHAGASVIALYEELCDINLFHTSNVPPIRWGRDSLVVKSFDLNLLMHTLVLSMVGKPVNRNKKWKSLKHHVMLYAHLMRFAFRRNRRNYVTL